MPNDRPEIIPYLFYEDVPAALAFLSRAFGLTEDMRTGTPSGGMHAEMRLGNARIMMGGGGSAHGMLSARQAGVATMGVFVYLDDVDAHHARARQAGATVEQAPHDESYGRTYTARDLEGHPWFFTTPPQTT